MTTPQVSFLVSISLARFLPRRYPAPDPIRRQLTIEAVSTARVLPLWVGVRVRGRADVVLGWRTARAGTCTRRTLSRFFYLIYQTLPHTPVHDPSCP